MNIGSSGSVMANRYNYYDLDPTYRNAFGLPLMRMTFDYKENEHKMGGTPRSRSTTSPSR
jgi:gluconate 2-dehydrogenase alpha chain